MSSRTTRIYLKNIDIVPDTLTDTLGGRFLARCAERAHSKGPRLEHISVLHLWYLEWSRPQGSDRSIVIRKDALCCIVPCVNPQACVGGGLQLTALLLECTVAVVLCSVVTVLKYAARTVMQPAAVLTLSREQAGGHL
ncbi:hypothetical protein NDU88_003423 [Pleurodeles waltl]|uniref:Uncharacterized protein n=1 Tax=Pleurodeles waltl TaxID=8319 RepID=A0AAV7TPK4_PLEWA|nr:hypothetical protein NDU88_003423 [Pleurodeles waltl]